jgi:cystathionine beta-lyase
MVSAFDCYIDRTCTRSTKWQAYGEGVIPLWVADMDFRAPDAVIEALRACVDHGIFGYAQEPPELRDVIVSRLASRYGWRVQPEDLVFMPGVVVGFNVAAQAVCRPGEGLLLQTPVYYPMLHAPANGGLSLQQMELTRGAGGSYTIDMDRMEAAVRPETRLYLMCNPHNPVGRAFTGAELEGLAALCARRGLVICSDEIHSDLAYPGHPHIPIAALDDETAQRTITLIAPSKTFNIPGLQFSVAVIQNPELRKAYHAACRGIVPHVGMMGYEAGLAAYRDGDAWLSELLVFLQENRDFVHRTVNECLPGVSMALPEATYLAWLDCREADLPGGPAAFFLDKARVALNEGGAFGRGGEGFARLNYGCCRELLEQALGQMEAALRAR